MNKLEALTTAELKDRIFNDTFKAYREAALEELLKRQRPHFDWDDEKANESWEFWKELVCDENGNVDVEQLKKELYDYSCLMSQVPIVYEHVTGGRLSKPNYSASVVTNSADEHFQGLIEDWEVEHA